MNLLTKGKKFDITGGNIMANLKWIPKPHTQFVLLNEVINLCDQLVQLRHPCPLHPGNYVLIYDQDMIIPSVFPKVVITILFSTSISFAL